MTEPENDNETVTPSCGCVFCDLELEPELVGDDLVHIVGGSDMRDIPAEAVKCTRPTALVVPFCPLGNIPS